MIARIALGGVLLMTTGCAPVPPSEEEYPRIGTGKTCKADPAQSLIGREASSELASEALRLSGAGVMRWLRPGEIVTMEYRADRLNITIDAQNRVTKISCG